VTAPTERITAAQLRPGDVVARLSRTRARLLPLATGRVAIESVIVDPDEARLFVRYVFASRRCSTACSENPYRCPHYGEAGGGAGGLPADEPLDRYLAH
jgi:hypothetical protein